MIPSATYIRKDILVTGILVIGTLLLGSFRPGHSMTQMEVLLDGSLNEMGGAEFTPQGNPLKPYAEITLKPATDEGWDIIINTDNFLRGGFNLPNPDHLAVGYPYLLVDGEKIGRFYQDTLHIPDLEDGDHIISVYYQIPIGGLYRVFGKPIGNSLYVTVSGEKYELAEF